MNKTKRLWILLPIFGSLLFVFLYLIATLYYPGGSQVDKNAIGFSWANNYWCNLLNETAINGKPNPAKPIAMMGMFVLCCTLTIFWILLPTYICKSKILKMCIQSSGTLSMFLAFFLFANINHDLITNAASLFGVIAIFGSFIGLYQSKWYGLFFFGCFNLLLVGVNNYFYYNKDLIHYLPIIQKISFASFLIWICCIDFKIYKISRK